MKLTDNMIRVINHAYTNNTKTEFLIKSNILQLRDKEIMVKALEVAAMISKLIEYIDTDAEKRFYAYLSSVEGYNKELIRERSIDKNLVTLKEFIIGNGLVYSEFLDYLYDSLVKYEFTSKSKDILTMSLNKTHTQLRNILNLKNGVINSTDLDDVKSELDRIDSLIESLDKDIVDKSSKVEEMNKSIESIRYNLLSLSMKTYCMPIDIANDIKLNADEICNELASNIKRMIEHKLEEQANIINKAITQQIDSMDTTIIERKLVQGIEERMQNLLDTVSTSVQSKVELITLDDIDRKVVNAIAGKVKNILNSAKSLNSDKILGEVAKMLIDIAEKLENVKIDSKAYKDIIDYNRDSINRYIK